MTPTAPSPLAVLPEILNLKQLGDALGMTPNGARLALKRGELGPYALIGRRAFVRRDSLLAALAAREITPTPRYEPPPVPRAPEWTRELLKGGRRRPGAG